MYQKTGAKLEEARKRQGISIREASEATRIRADVLLNFEAGSMEFPLPEVYRRGFLKLYARYLKLSPDKIIAEYQAETQGGMRPAALRREVGAANLLGRVDLPQETAAVPHAGTVDDDAPETAEDSNSAAQAATRRLYIRTGIIFGGTFAAVALILLAINLFRRQDSPREAVTQSQPMALRRTTLEASTQAAAEAQPEERDLAVVATGEVHVVIRQECDRQRLFSGTLSAGQRRTFHCRGPVRIHFSDGSRFLVEKPSGEKVRPGREGLGCIEI